MTIETTKSDARYYQFTVENQVLDHVKTALRKTLASDEDRMGLERKVSTVKFVTESLVRHLRRLLDLEDEEGFDPTETTKPHLAEKAAALQREHEQFREHLNRLGQSVAHITPDDEPHFNALCADLLALLDRLDKHEAAELQVLQELHNSDEGGEG
jgi:hypothetical protein